MKCFFRSNIVYLVLFLIICFANCIIIDTNFNSKINILSKPESQKLLKINEIKKIAENELKILKVKKERIEKSMKRLDEFNDKKLDSDDNIILKIIYSNLSMIISIIALLIGFIFAGIFLVIAFLLSE